MNQDAVMTCQFKNPLSRDALYQAIDGEAGSEILTHLAGCEYCRARRDAILQFETILRHSLHPTVQDLVDFAGGLLSEGMQMVIEKHLETCKVCQYELAELKQLSEEIDDQPGANVTAKILLFPDHRVIPVAPLEARSNLLVALGIENRPGIRNLTLHFEGLDLMMTLESVRSGIILSGHLLTEDMDDQALWAGAIVRVVAMGGSGDRMTMLDADGNFRYAVPFAPGPADVVIRSSRKLIVTTTVNLSVDE
jgi:hypothetical protein